jgi:hypothetical protein
LDEQPGLAPDTTPVFVSRSSLRAWRRHRPPRFSRADRGSVTEPSSLVGLGLGDNLGATVRPIIRVWAWLTLTGFLVGAAMLTKGFLVDTGYLTR